MGKAAERDLDAMFAAGAYSAYVDMGMREKDAEAVAEEMCKIAARRVRYVDDDDEDKEDTWWNRNKWWVLPSAIGTGAFLLGANSASSESSRPDRGHWVNAGSYIWNKVKKLFGQSDDPMWNALTRAEERRIVALKNNEKALEQFHIPSEHAFDPHNHKHVETARKLGLIDAEDKWHQ